MSSKLGIVSVLGIIAAGSAISTVATTDASAQDNSARRILFRNAPTTTGAIGPGGQGAPGITGSFSNSGFGNTEPGLFGGYVFN